MREKRDRDTNRRMAAAMIIIVAVVVTVILGFSQLRKKQQVETAYAESSGQEEATVKIADVYEEKKEITQEDAGAQTETTDQNNTRTQTETTDQNNTTTQTETAIQEETEVRKETADQEDMVVRSDDENEDIYLVRGEEKKSNKYDRVDKLTYTDSVRYTREEIQLLDQYGLRITRNEIFARHGRMFNDQELQKYFDNQSWYVPKYSPSDFDDSCLNEIEQYNVNLLMSYEQAQGYQ